MALTSKGSVRGAGSARYTAVENRYEKHATYQQIDINTYRQALELYQEATTTTQSYIFVQTDRRTDGVNSSQQTLPINRVDLAY